MANLEVDIYKKTGNFELSVSFQTGREIMAILGASGCGKSMTLKCIAGIEVPDRGRIVLNGKILFDSEKHINLAPQKRNVGYMFQDYALFPNMTVLQNITIAIRKGKKQEKLEKARDFVSRFHLAGLENHLPGQLSGGQKQRVAMARMLAAEPEIILLDEPFSALDSYLKWELEQEMKETLERLNKTTLFVSHNRDEVYRLCQSVAIINNGKMEEPTEMKEFFRNPRTKAAALLSGCKNITAVKKLDDHQLEAEEWGMKIRMEAAVPDHVKYVGIRAHQLIPCEIFKSHEIQTSETTVPGMASYIPVRRYRLIEDPFEWNLFFCADENKGWIQWKIAKTDWDGRKIPAGFTVKEEDIMLLEESG